MRNLHLSHSILIAFALVVTACGAEPTDEPQGNTPNLFGDAQANDAQVDGGRAQDANLADTGAQPDVVTNDAGVADTTPIPDTTAQADTGAASDTGAQADTGGQADAGNQGDTSGGSDASQGGKGAKEFNQGFIGGACAVDGQCSYTGGFCATSQEGFPNGMCSSPCTKFCPDQTGMATTFCVTSAEVGVSNPPGMCTVRCDFGKSPTGCRPGYSCVKMKRYNDPGTTMMACVPGDSGAGSKLSTCQEKLLARGVGFSTLPNPKATPKGGSSALCQITDFLSVDPTIAGVAFRASSTKGSKLKLKVKCEFAHALVDMAEEFKAQGVKEVIHWGTYNCRYIGGTKTLSEHGFANAIDIAGFKMNDGSYHSVLKGWEKGVSSPKTPGGKVLKWFADTMYKKHIFNIILTPEYNAAHADHFHVDLTPGSWFKQSFDAFGAAHAGCDHPQSE